MTLIRLKHFYQLRDSETWFVVKLLVFILCAYGLVGSMDYADEQRSVAMRHEQARNNAEQAFVKCLNGGWVAQTETHAIVCSKAWEVKK